MRLRRHTIRCFIPVVMCGFLILGIYYHWSSPVKISSDKPGELLSLSLIEKESSSTNDSARDIPDIFDLALWRLILIGGQGNQTLCKVPPIYESIAEAYCRAQGRSKCLELPCTLIYHSDAYNEEVECLRGGQRALLAKPDWICRKSPALELFSNRTRKPSVSAEAFTTLTAELFGQALAPFRDEETSKWGLRLDGESVAYYPSAAKNRRILSLFDITLGYDRRLFDLITDVHLTPYEDQITNRDQQRVTMREVLASKTKGLPPILWINSNCDTPSNRTGYMLELMKYIRVDVRGKCGAKIKNSSDFNASDERLWAGEKTILSREYLFTVAIENSLEYDYVTEKLWQPLAVGSVPLYLGAPNIDDWLPCDQYPCIIDLRQFKTPRDLARFIDVLAENQTLYAAYHRWRGPQSQLKKNFTKMIDYFHQANKHSIECLLCDMVYRRDHGTIRRKLLAANDPFKDEFPSLA